MDSNVKLLFNSILRPLGTFHISLLLVITLVISQVTATLIIDGSPGSFIQYDPWEPCSNGSSLSFEFKTEEPNSLLLYLNRGEFMFYELLLQKGMVRLRIKADREGQDILIIYNGRSLNDNRWHKAEIREEGPVMYFTVDGAKKESHSNRGSSSNNTIESFLFFGGLPEKWNKRTRTLANPSIILEPRFRGSFRNLFYANCGGEPSRPGLLESKGLLTSDVDLCKKGNPCLNGGQCLTTENGLYCNCEYTEYKGDRCEIQRKPSDATFLGTQYITYNFTLKDRVLLSDQDSISLDFRTKQANSLLFYTGNLSDHITIALKDGYIYVTVDLGSGRYRKQIKPKQGRFNDNRWHQLEVTRDAKEVEVIVDGMYSDKGTTTGTYTRLSSSVLFVAGSSINEKLLERGIPNFKGCMRKVMYRGDAKIYDIMSLSRSGHDLLTVVGNILYDKCHQLVDSQPVTFTTPEAYVTVSTWDRPSLRGSLAFQFQTIETGGLMMYSNGNRDSHDFFAMELVDGHLYLIVDMGSGIEKIKASNIPVANGKPHDVYYEFTGNSGYISVDGQKETFASTRVSDRFDLHGLLYVGGIGSEINTSSLPYELWSAKLGQSYVGCVQDLVVNGRQVDLVAAAKIQNRNDVQSYCRRVHDECTDRPCNHGGKCVKGWNRYTCDCRYTGYMGSVCQTAATTLRFDGMQYMQVHMPREMITQAEDISLRFRTMHTNGLLFETVGQATDGYKLFLRANVLYLSINVGGSEQVLSVSVNQGLNDDQWHTVIIKRRHHTVHLTIDQERPVTEQRGRRRRTKRVHHSKWQRDEGIPEGFVGSMQSFTFNGKQFFEMVNSGSNHEIEITAHYSSDEYVVRNPVTFNSEDAYAMLPTLNLNDQYAITFQLKTTEQDGILFYSGGKGNDFFSMELYQGFLYYIYDMGEGPQRVKANTIHPMNDNKWHEVLLLRKEEFKQLLRVDANTPTVDDITGNKNTLFDLQTPLYVGGVEKMMYPSLPQLIQSRHGFVGCLGSLNLDDHKPDLLKDANPIQAVGDGCRGPSNKCLKESCANKGRCVQQWTSYSCDCDMTSYTGDKCKDESTTYRFVPGPSAMTFTFPEDKRQSTNSEGIAFGFMSYQDNAVILRMESVVYDDFIQFELLKGNMYVTYNMGTLNHPIGDFFKKVNDGHYHVVVFTRAGPNATLQIDSRRPQTKYPTGKQAYTFNQQAHIRVGGKVSKDGSIEDQYIGTMSGLVINGIRVFELAKDNDVRITLTGSVERQVKPGESSEMKTGEEGIDQMQSTQGRYETLEIRLPNQFFQKNQKNSTMSRTVRSLFPSPYSKRKDSQTRKTKMRKRHQYRLKNQAQYGPSPQSTLENSEKRWKQNDATQKPKPNEAVVKALEKVLSYLNASTEWKNGHKQESKDYYNNLGSKLNLHQPEVHHSEMNVSCPDCGNERNKHRSNTMKQKFTMDSSQSDSIHPRWSKLVADDSNWWTSDVKEDETDIPVDDNIKLHGHLHDDEDNLNGRDGSGWMSPDDFVTASQWVVQPKVGFYRHESSTIISPFLSQRRSQVPLPTIPSHRAHWNVYPSHTTPRDGVTDDIVYAGSGCQSDDEDSCTLVGSGNDPDGIISPVILIKSTTPPPTSTIEPTTKKPCNGHECETSSKLEQPTNKSGKTYEPNQTASPKVDGITGESSAKPSVGGNKDDDDDKGINLALILGIIGSVLVAIIVLCVAWCKLRSRDEGTYKVDETQNFSALQSKKSNGNGALMAGSDVGTGKRGKKKDVKEWYV